ncbi:MAG: hypothetical protein GDA68_04165 [Nitrospira sp. CR2.1]|nr:hypothetical protein [Nitrospira sp. CR2.1]
MKRTMPFAVATMIAVAGLALATTGCSAVAQKGMPEDVADRIARENGTADDHIAAAMLYLQKAKQVQTRADEYQAVASTITPLEDPKGIRRSGLMTAAQTRRNDAAELQQLYAAHYEKAQTLLGKQQPQ